MHSPYVSESSCPKLGIAAVLALGIAACNSEPDDHSASAIAQRTVPAAAGATPSAPPQPAIDPPAQRDSANVPGSDGTLAAMVVSALSAEPELNANKIDVTAVDGTVFLRGAARDRETRRLATQVATPVDGVKRVQNELFVTAGS